MQAIRFRLGEWILARNDGVDYNLLIGHRISPALAATAISEVIRQEGGAEVRQLRDVRYTHNRADRLFTYAVMVDTIYGPMEISEGVG